MHKADREEAAKAEVAAKKAAIAAKGVKLEAAGPDHTVPALQENAVAVSPEAMKGDWGAVADLETSDLLVPKIYHQQSMSKFVAEGKARPGDFMDSLTGELLCPKEKPLEVIIFGSFKTLIVQKFEPIAKKFKLLEIITVTPENSSAIAALPFEEEKVDAQGVRGRYKNSLYYNFYCLIPGKINEIPYVLSMGSTKTKAAKKLNTLIYKLSKMKPARPSASAIFQLKSTDEKNDQGAWQGLEVSQGRDVTAEELMKAFAWHVKSKTQAFVVVEEEASEEASANIPAQDDETPF